MHWFRMPHSFAAPHSKTPCGARLGQEFKKTLRRRTGCPMLFGQLNWREHDGVRVCADAADASDDAQIIEIGRLFENQV